MEEYSGDNAKYNEYMKKYLDEKRKLYYLGNGFRIGSLISLAVMMIIFLGTGMTSYIVKVLPETIFLIMFFCAVTGTGLVKKWYYDANMEHYSGQPYKGILFVFSAFACGVVLCYFIR